MRPTGLQLMQDTLHKTISQLFEKLKVALALRFWELKKKTTSKSNSLKKYLSLTLLYSLHMI